MQVYVCVCEFDSNFVNMSACDERAAVRAISWSANQKP